MIQYFNRKTKKIEIEKVYGDALVNWGYQTKLGYWVTQYLLTCRWVSVLMGWYQNTRFSLRGLPEFIKNYEIKMDEYEPGPFKSFNDFFIRKFKPGIRVFLEQNDAFSAGAEARYLALENVSKDSRFPVKGIEINLHELVGSDSWGGVFEGGTVIIARLCPVDYHRYHFPTSGTIKASYFVPGEYHSVNPVALAKKPDIIFKNERHVTLIENSEFGLYAMIEVGALGVGKIIQSYTGNQAVRGQEKGYFLFGGSTVVFVLQKNRLKIDADLLENSLRGVETWIPLGDSLGFISKS